jgi:phage terminase small subunit
LNADRYEAFAREYVVDLNGKRAAIAAGYAEASAEVKASQLLRIAKCRALINALLSKRASKLEVKAEHVVEEISRLAFSNLHDYIRIDGDGQADIDLSALTRDQAAAISEFIVDTTGGTGDGERRKVLRTKIKLVDKTKNLELLCRHLGMLNDRLQVTGLEGLAERVNKLNQAEHVSSSNT